MMNTKQPMLLFASITIMATSLGCIESDAAYIRRNYDKREVRIPMRDGVKLFTAVYTPKNRHRSYPILMIRTPYTVGPYGEAEYKQKLGPHMDYARDGYIFVYQDVRGAFMSEGEFVNMRPHIPNKSEDQVDESSDTYDTIDWLLKNVRPNNGRVGMWGISYPGFYAAAGMIDAHPALKAVSPQAPIADWYFDDFHHHGAFFLPHAFNFLASFGKPRPEPTTEWHPRFKHGTPDGFQFFKDLGPLRNVNEKHFHGEIEFWNKIVEHPNYDDFWQSRNILPHLKNSAPAVMTVGGWFDAEDLYGPLEIYRSVERHNPDCENMLVMGPWQHGGWGRTLGNRLGNVTFGSLTSKFYRENIEIPFFRHHLKEQGELDLPEAFVFETGANEWRRFDAWPPAAVQEGTLELGDARALSFEAAVDQGLDHDAFISDPEFPVPFTEDIAIGMTKNYMTDDQRFASRRPDVLSYQTEILKQDLTLAGPIVADLWVSTSQSAADWVVKLIDVHPGDLVTLVPLEPYHPPQTDRPMGGYQMMVRSEVLRGRYRNSYEKPEPFTPDEPTQVSVKLQDVLHTFKAGHRIMIQIQSTWFPLVDLNPQKFVPNIFEASERDFVKATHRVHHSAEHPSRIRVHVLPETTKVTARTPRDRAPESSR